MHSSLILAMGSEVFCGMFMGPMGKKDLAEVAIPNYTADVFKIMLEFLYSDRTPHLTAENAMEVMKCADQYQIPELQTKCRAFILDVLHKADQTSVENCLLYWMEVCTDVNATFSILYQSGSLFSYVYIEMNFFNIQARKIDDSEIIGEASEFLAYRAELVLACPTFLDISHEVLLEVAKKSDLNLHGRESLLYRAASE